MRQVCAGVCDRHAPLTEPVSRVPSTFGTQGKNRTVGYLSHSLSWAFPWPSMISSTVRLIRQAVSSAFLHLVSLAKSLPRLAVSSVLRIGSVNGDDSRMARANRPLDAGEDRWNATEVAPYGGPASRALKESSGVACEKAGDLRPGGRWRWPSASPPVNSLHTPTSSSTYRRLAKDGNLRGITCVGVSH